MTYPQITTVKTESVVEPSISVSFFHPGEIQIKRWPSEGKNEEYFSLHFQDHTAGKTEICVFLSIEEMAHLGVVYRKAMERIFEL
jgi:hypothetical protein